MARGPVLPERMGSSRLLPVVLSVRVTVSWLDLRLASFMFPSLGSERLANCVPCWGRSEEHTSELQSLMRISYAVFCLKKKKDARKEQHAHPYIDIQRCHDEDTK